MTCAKNLRVVLVCVFWIFITGSLEAQTLERGGADLRSNRGRFSLFSGVGLGQADAFDRSRFVVELEPRYELKRDDRNILDLTFPLFWMPGRRPLRDDPGILLEGKKTGEIETGSTFAFAPSLEWSPRTLRCCRYAFSFGAGLWLEQGRRSSSIVMRAEGDVWIPVEVDVRTPESHSPFISLGATLRRPISDRLELWYRLRLNATFYPEQSVATTFGEIRLPSATRGSAFLTLGIRFKP